MKKVLCILIVLLMMFDITVYAEPKKSSFDKGMKMGKLIVELVKSKLDKKKKADKKTFNENLRVYKDRKKRVTKPLDVVVQVMSVKELKALVMKARSKADLQRIVDLIKNWAKQYGSENMSPEIKELLKDLESLLKGGGVERNINDIFSKFSPNLSLTLVEFTFIIYLLGKKIVNPSY